MLNSIKAIAITGLLFMAAASADAGIPGHGNQHPFMSENRQGLSVASGFNLYVNTAGLRKDAPMALLTDGDMAAFTGSGSNSDYALGFASGSILLGQDSFQSGFLSGSGWFSAAENGRLTAFTDPADALQNNPAKLSANNAKASAMALVPVPLPAAIWAMMSALLGMLYVGRRKSVI